MSFKKIIILNILCLFFIANNANCQVNIKPSKRPSATSKQPDFQRKVIDTTYIDSNEVTRIIKVKMNILQLCLQILVAKEKGYQNVIDKYAMPLFDNNENAVIQVQNMGEITPHQMPVRQYFERISRLKYDHIDIKYYKYSYLSPLKKGKDNLTYATFYVEQEFRGFNDLKSESPGYEETTGKSIDIIVKLEKELSSNNIGQKVRKFNIALGNILVVHQPQKINKNHKK